MARRKGRLRVNHRSERIRDAVKPLVGGMHGYAARLQRQHGMIEAGAVGEGGPPGAIPPPRAHEVDESRVEPTAASLPSHVDRGVDAVLTPVHLERLREQQNPRQQRDLIARHADRMPESTPVLIDVRDSLACGPRESKNERDLCTAFAARLNDLAGHGWRTRNA